MLSNYESIKIHYSLAEETSEKETEAFKAMLIEVFSIRFKSWWHKMKFRNIGDVIVYRWDGVIQLKQKVEPRPLAYVIRYIAKFFVEV